MRSQHRAGFTMVEVLVCLLLLGVLCLVAAAYGPLTHTAAELETELATLNGVRAKMEELVAGPAVAAAGSDTLVVRGGPVVRTWWSAPCDLDGEGTPEPDAFRMHVEMAGVALETIRTDPGGVDAIVR